MVKIPAFQEAYILDVQLISNNIELKIENQLKF